MKTVKVRIAVAVDPFGNWCAAGWNGTTEDKLRHNASENVDSGERIYWLTAELEVPEGHKEKDIPAAVSAISNGSAAK